MLQTRRQALLSGARGLGGIALASMLSAEGVLHAAKITPEGGDGSYGVLQRTHFPAKAKRVIYLFFSGRSKPYRHVRFSPRDARVSWRGTT